MAHVGGIHARGNPSFPEVEVEVFKGDSLRFGFLQSLPRLSHLRHPFTFGIVFHPALYTFRLLYHVPRDEAVFDFVTGYERVVEDAPFEGIEQFLLRGVGYLPHIAEIDRAELVERRGQGFFGSACIDTALHREGHGTVEDVSLDELAVLRTFQRKDVAPSGIHHHQLHVLFGVEVAVTHDKLVITDIEVFAPWHICHATGRFIAVQPLVSVTERYIQQRFFFLVASQSKRLESRSVGSDVFQIPDVACPVCHQRPFTQVHFRRAVIGTRFHIQDFLLLFHLRIVFRL